MSRIPTHTLESAPEAARPTLAMLAQRAGWDEPQRVTLLSGESDDQQLAEAFAFAGLTHYVDAFLLFARTELDPPLAQRAPEAPAADQADATRLTTPLIVEDQDRTRTSYEQVRGARVVRERDPASAA